MEEIFKALSENNRLRIVSLLLKGEICVCEIECILKMTQSNVSRHLTILKNAGIICGRRHAQWVFYKLNEDFIKNHPSLYSYLLMELTKLATYEADQKQIGICKKNGICDC